MKVLKWSLGVAVVSASVFSYGANLLTSGKIKADVISGPLQYLGGITGITSLSENTRTKRESTVTSIGRSHEAAQHVSSNNANSRGYVSVSTIELDSPDSVYQPEIVTWDHSSAKPISGYRLESNLGNIAAVNKADWLEFSKGSSGSDGANRPLTTKSIVPADVTTVSPIPEPATYLMMLAGFALISLIAKRQQRAVDR